MNRIVLQLIVLAALVASSFPAFGQDPQVIEIPLSRPGDPIRLEIGIMSARIEVIGEDREDAYFEITVADGQRKIVTPSGTKSIKGGGYAFEIEEDDNEISVDADWRANKVEILARVPRSADLELGTTNDGEIIVRNVTGTMELANTNGPITATGVAGAVIAESVNADVNVDFRTLDGASAISLSTVSGNVTIGLPPDTGAQLHLDSSQGEIYSDFEVDVQPARPIVERDDQQGGTAVRIENVIVANINGGGPVIRMTSLNGDLNIKRSTGRSDR